MGQRRTRFFEYIAYISGVSIAAPRTLIWYIHIKYCYIQITVVERIAVILEYRLVLYTDYS